MKKHIKKLVSVYQLQPIVNLIWKLHGSGRVRELGSEMNGESDVWFRTGGYTQTDFPKQMLFGVVTLKI